MKNPIYIIITCFLFTVSYTFACDSCPAHAKESEVKKPSSCGLGAAAGSAAAQSCALKCAAKKSAGVKDGSCAYPLKTCVVSGEALDAMGKPYVFSHGDWNIQLCCEDCKEDFLAAPDKYLAKLKTACKSAQKSCGTACVKPCCAEEKGACGPGCTKPCCAVEKAACGPACTKPCCAVEKAACGPGCIKACCATDKPACAEGCTKPCCAKGDTESASENPPAEEAAQPAVPSEA